MRELNQEELAEEAREKHQNYIEDLESGDYSPCCGAEITDIGFCSDCKEHIL